MSKVRRMRKVSRMSKERGWARWSGRARVEGWERREDEHWARWAGWAMLLGECTIFIWRTCEAGTFSNLRQGRRANNSPALPQARQLLIGLQSAYVLFLFRIVADNKRTLYISHSNYDDLLLVLPNIYAAICFFVWEETLYRVSVTRFFAFGFFSWISLPPAPENPIRTVSNFFENSWIYSHVKVHHQYQWHLWQIMGTKSGCWDLIVNLKAKMYL